MSAPDYPLHIVADDRYVFIASDQTVYRMNAAARNHGEEQSSLVYRCDGGGLFLAQDDDRVFIGVRANGVVLQAGKTDLTLTVVARVPSLGGIAVSRNSLFWTERTSGQVVMVDLRSHRTSLIATGQPSPTLIATDGQRLAWANTQGGHDRAPEFEIVVDQVGDR